MQKPLETGSHIIIDAEKYVIQDVIGIGASSIVYYAKQESGRRVVVKEFYPLVPDCKRCEDGSIVVEERDKSSYKEAMERFVDGFKTQFRFRNTNDKLANSIFDAERIGQYNSTQYIVTSYMVGKSLEKMQPRSMYQLLKLVRAVSVLVQEYHNQGYLHLDIKPENIFRRSDTDDTVILFDFDSIKKIDDIKGGKVTLLSYSPIWAAPELRQGRMEAISEATDIFSLGAVVFCMLFERNITALDCRSNSEWEFEFNHPLFDNVVSKTKLIEGLKEFFHKTIVSNPKRRYQDIAQIIEAIDGLLVHANTKEVRLLSTFKYKNTFFIGRENEMKQIDKLIAQERMIFIHGVGGIGKTELAKQYANDRYDQYDAVVFGICEPDIKSYVISDKNITLQNWDERTERTEEYYQNKIKMLKSICSNQKILLIVDNLDDLEDKKLNDLEDLGCDVIVTTRVDCGTRQLPYISIEQIEDATRLFYLYYRRPVTEEEKLVIKNIVLQKLLGHTMFVIIVANIMMLHRISPKEMLDKMENSEMGKWGNDYARIKKDGELKYDRVIEIGKTLFNTAQMTDVELYIMGNMALIPKSGISAKFFKELLKLESYVIINLLADKGMIQIDNIDDRINLHPIVAEIFMDTVAQHREWGTDLLEGLFHSIENEHGSYKKNELYEIVFVVTELIHTYATKKLDYDKFHELIANRILYGKMLGFEFDVYGYYPTPSDMRFFVDKMEKETFSYYKLKIAYLDINIYDSNREKEYITVLDKLLSFAIGEAYLLRMHIITMLLINGPWGRACAPVKLEKCRSLFLDSKCMYQLIQENNENMDVICCCKKQLLLQAACIENKIIENKKNLYLDKKFKRIHPASYEMQRCKELMKELEAEIETGIHYKELKEMYRLLYQDKNIDWKLQFADVLIEVGELADQYGSMYINSFLAEALDIYVNRFGEKNRIVNELYVKFAEKFGEKEYHGVNFRRRCNDKNIARIVNYYNKSLKNMEVFYGENCIEGAFIHVELGKYHRMAGNSLDSKMEYDIAIEKLGSECTNPEEIWRTFETTLRMHIEYSEYERALDYVERTFTRCSQLDFSDTCAVGMFSFRDFFEIGKHCNDVRRFEKCIEMYKDIYINEKGFYATSFYRDAGDYYFEQLKYYEAEQYYQLWMEMDEFEFCDKKEECEYLLRRCKIDAEIGNISKAKENIANIMAVCETYEIKGHKDLKYVTSLMLQMYNICEENIQDEDMIDVIIKKSIKLFDTSNICAFDLYMLLFVTYATHFTQKKDYEKVDLYWGSALYYCYCVNAYEEAICEDEEVDILDFVHCVCENALPRLCRYYKYMEYLKKSKWAGAKRKGWIAQKVYLAEIYNDFMVLVCYFMHKEEEAAIRMSSNIIAKWGHVPEVIGEIEKAYDYIAKCRLKADWEVASTFNARVQKFFEVRSQEVANFIAMQNTPKES